MHRLLTAFIMAGLVVGSTPAVVFAQDDSSEETAKEVEKLSKEGAKAYRSRDYAKAIDLFEKAYELEPVPNLLFNIAKVYEKMEKWDEAIEYYEKFVVAPDVDSEARQMAMDRIDTLKEVVADDGGEGDEGEKVAAEESDEETEDDGEEVTPPDEPDEGSGNGLAFAVLGGSTAVLIGGGVFGLLANGQQTAFAEAGSVETKRDAQKKARTYALVADIMYATGVIGAAVGVIMLVTGGSAETEEPQTAGVTGVGGWADSDGAGVGIIGRF